MGYEIENVELNKKIEEWKNRMILKNRFIIMSYWNWIECLDFVIIRLFN